MDSTPRVTIQQPPNLNPQGIYNAAIIFITSIVKRKALFPPVSLAEHLGVHHYGLTNS